MDIGCSGCTLKSMYNWYVGIVGYSNGLEIITFIKLLIVVFKGVK